ncbi:hypothetical protein [Inquilinus limosus]|uniref:hypothetical protein n=1 Tax=Inquilinus limosus TaxID=171674 RepID=UPI001198212F|nr:hypothetical protein [Inquilinus limosus]
MEQKDITITLSPAEALVLFEWLARTDAAQSLPTEHPAETRALWRLEGKLQKQIGVLFSNEYGNALEEARSELLRLYGE